MTGVPLRVDAYVRVSKVAGGAGESFISPFVQRERIEGWARLNGPVLTWHKPELDVGGGSTSRPIFDHIMGRIRAGESDGVIVAKLDRFARTLVGALGVLEEFERHGAVLVSVADNLDLSTPMGKAFLRILLVFAELERDRISESWKTATSNAVDRGIHIAKFTPVGYDKAPDKRLLLGGEAPAIREAFLWRAAGRSRTEIARRLDETATRPNGGRWTPPMVERIIKNRVYLGHAYRGDQVNKTAHPAVVTLAEWQAANLAPVRAAPRGKKPNLLGGIARCAGCRYVLAPGKSRWGGSGDSVLGYRCRGIHTAGVCPEPASINAHKLERHVKAVWRNEMATQAGHGHPRLPGAPDGRRRALSGTRRARRVRRRHDRTAPVGLRLSPGARRARHRRPAGAGRAATPDRRTNRDRDGRGLRRSPRRGPQADPRQLNRRRDRPPRPLPHPRRAARHDPLARRRA
jgi:site-specific DNA recombinase